MVGQCVQTNCHTASDVYCHTARHQHRSELLSADTKATVRQHVSKRCVFVDGLCAHILCVHKVEDFIA